MIDSDSFGLDRGFLPANDPLLKLPEQYKIWDQMGRELPKLLISTGSGVFQDLPVLSPNRLTSIPQLERAMMLLSFFGHAFIWGDKNPASYLPKSIALPWYQVAEKLQRPPVLSYASYALNNWRRIRKENPVELGNITLLQNFLGGMDEEWFVLVHVEIEMKAAPALQAFNDAQKAVQEKNDTLLEQKLEVIRSALTQMCSTLDRMPERCDPYIYYNRVRPYIHGWKDNPSLTQGMVYEGVDAYENKPQEFRGETGAQSSIIPAFDALFGIKHRHDPLRVYLMEMREYMPSSHRVFLEQLEKKGSIRDFIVGLRRSAPSLRESYNHCLELLARFRKTHLSYAAQYIQKQSQTSLANPTSTGTGGTPFMSYLRKHKDETLEYIIKK